MIIKHGIKAAMVVIFVPSIREHLHLITQWSGSQNSKDAGCLVKSLLVHSTSTGLSAAAELCWWKRFSVCWEGIMSLCRKKVLHVAS